MWSLEDNAKALVDFGLTQNQARVYIAIVQLGVASVSQASRASTVRREDVYRMLPKLEKMGLIEKILGSPIRIRAVPLEEALSILVSKEEKLVSKKVSDLKAKKDLFLRSFKTRKAELMPEGEETQFALLSQRDLILSKIMTMIKNCQKELNVVTSREAAVRFIQAYSKQLQKAIRKGVNIRIVSEIPEYEDLLLKTVSAFESKKASLELKCIDSLPCQSIVSDYKEMLVATSKEIPWEESSGLWTNNRDLLEVMQRNFEDVWHSAVHIKTIETKAVSEKVIRFVKELKPTSHAIFVYESSEAKHNVLFNYLKVGLENGEAAAYVATEETPDELREAMKRFGIDVEENEETGALRIHPYTDLYIIDGKFNALTTMGLWNKMFRNALDDGFKGLRVTGEMSCFFKHNMVQELIEYERALHRILDVPMIAICAYNSKLLNQTRDPINVYSELVRAHGTVLFTGIDNRVGMVQIRKA